MAIPVISTPVNVNATDAICLYCNFVGRTYTSTKRITGINLLFKDKTMKTNFSVEINKEQAKGIQQVSFICRKMENEVQSEKLCKTLSCQIDRIKGLALRVEIDEKDFQSGLTKQTYQEVSVDLMSELKEKQKYRLLISSSAELNVQAKFIRIFTLPDHSKIDKAQQQEELTNYLFLMFVPVMQMMSLELSEEVLNLINLDQTVAELRSKNDEHGKGLVENFVQTIKKEDLDSLHYLLSIYQKASSENFKKEMNEYSDAFNKKCFELITAKGLEKMMTHFLARIANLPMNDPKVFDLSIRFRKIFIK